MHDIIAEYAKDRPPYVLRKWKYRGHVPHKDRLPILMEAAKRGVSLKESDFVFTKPKVRRPRPTKQKRKAA
jgi:hypothetical protein